MDRTLKALSLVLSYPTRELQAAMPEIGGVLASDTRLTAAARRALRPLVEELIGRDIYELEEQYVMLFDRSRTLSLNLFEHVHGESRDRGGMIALGDWGLQNIKSGTDDVSQLGTFYLPVRDQKEDPYRVVVQGDSFMGVTTHSKNPELAKAFVEWFYSED